MLLDKLLRRGLISGIYPESVEFRSKAEHLLTKPVTVYTGFDATGTSLHIGHLATIINSLYFQSYGHQVIWVVGDATAQVGDPSGHSKDRKQIAQAVIQVNASAIERTLRRLARNFRECFLEADSKSSIKQACKDVKIKEPIIVRNSEWYRNENVVEFVDRIFREVRVGGLLHKKSVRERLKSAEGFNMAEFSYQIFQAYDWMELRRRYNCKIQIGGNDQQGNIYTGHALIKKVNMGDDAIGLLAPLITNSKGTKLGKSSVAPDAKSNFWLDPELTSAFDLYQHFLRTADSDVEKMLRIFSFHTDEHIEEIVRTYLRNKSDIWHCHRKLAEHVCLLVHGQEALSEAKRATESLIEKKASKRQ